MNLMVKNWIKKQECYVYWIGIRNSLQVALSISSLWISLCCTKRCFENTCTRNWKKKPKTLWSYALLNIKIKKNTKVLQDKKDANIYFMIFFYFFAFWFVFYLNFLNFKITIINKYTYSNRYTVFIIIIFLLCFWSPFRNSYCFMHQKCTKLYDYDNMFHYASTTYCIIIIFICTLYHMQNYKF